MAISYFTRTFIFTGFTAVVTVTIEDLPFCNNSEEDIQTHSTGEVLKTSATNETKDS